MFKIDFCNPDGKVRPLCMKAVQPFQMHANGLFEIGAQLLHRVARGKASRKGRNLSPKRAIFLVNQSIVI